MKFYGRLLLSVAIFFNGPSAYSKGFFDFFKGNSSKQVTTNNINNEGSNGNHFEGGNNGNGVGNTGPGNQGNGPNKDWAGNSGGDKGYHGDHRDHDIHESHGDHNDHGNGNGGNGNNNQNQQQQDVQTKKSSAWRATIIPVPYLDFDFGKKIINESDVVPELGFTGTGAPAAGNYRVVKYSSLDIGAGVAAVIYRVPLMTNSFIAVPGLLPIWGTKAVIDRHVNSPEESSNLKINSFPVAFDDVTSWATGDSITYQSTGSIVFFAGAGIPIGVGGALSATAEGQWNTTVQKAGATSVVVTLKKSKINSYRVNVGHVLISVGAEKFNNSDESITFSFDSNAPEILAAYNEFVKGNIGPAQDLINAGNSSVRVLHTLTGTGKGGGHNLWIGIPILANHVSNSGISFNHQETFDVDDVKGSITKSKYDLGTYAFNSANKFFFRHNSTKGGFTGYHVSTIAEEGEIADDALAEIRWQYENDHATAKNLKNAMDELVELTGMEKDLVINMPNIDKLGYLNVTFTASLSKDQSKYLISLGQDPGLHNRLVALGTQTNTTVITRICQNYANEYGSDPCVTGETRRMEFELRSVTESLQKMYLTYQTKNWEEFSKAYATFGKGILKSRYTYQTFLALMKGNNFDMNLEISGEKLIRFQKPILD